MAQEPNRTRSRSRSPRTRTMSDYDLLWSIHRNHAMAAMRFHGARETLNSMGKHLDNATNLTKILLERLDGRASAASASTAASASAASARPASAPVAAPSDGAAFRLASAPVPPCLWLAGGGSRPGCWLQLPPPPRRSD